MHISPYLKHFEVASMIKLSFYVINKQHPVSMIISYQIIDRNPS